MSSFESVVGYYTGMGSCRDEALQYAKTHIFNKYGTMEAFLNANVGREGMSGPDYINSVNYAEQFGSDRGKPSLFPHEYMSAKQSGVAPSRTTESSYDEDFFDDGPSIFSSEFWFGKPKQQNTEEQDRGARKKSLPKWH